MEGLGYTFWLKLAGVFIGGAIALFVVLMLFARAIFAWGILGTFLGIALVLLLVGWVYDRHEARHRPV